jgi:heme oxygenase
LWLAGFQRTVFHVINPRDARPIATGARSVTTLEQLRAATWPIHRHMEMRIDVKGRFSLATSYRSHLTQMWGFCAMVESLIDPACACVVLPDYDSRRKLGSLTQDLVALGMPRADVRQLRRCDSLRLSGDPSATLGCMYVLEGASLGGRTLLPLIERNLGLTATHGATFMASYGSEIDAMWRRFGMTLEAWCSSTDRSDAAIRSAVATFESLEQWLCEECA